MAFGLQWNQTTDTYLRLDDAFGLSVDNSSSPHVSDFSDYLPWSGIKRCNLADDYTVNAYYGDDDYKDDGSNGMVMVEIPKFYYKTTYTTTDGNVWQWKISMTQEEGYLTHPVFLDNGLSSEYIYVSAYEGYNNDGTLESKSGVQPTVSQNIKTFRTQAQEHGSGWGLYNFSTISAIQLLYLIEYGTMYSQNVLSEGITNLDTGTANHSQNTGHTSVFGNLSGEVTILEASLENGATGDDTYPFSYRGIENLYGNIIEFVDGILVKDDGYYIGDSIDDYSNVGTDYTQNEATPSFHSGYSTNFENLANMDYAFMPNTTDGGIATGYTTDYFYSHNPEEVSIVTYSGYWNNTSRAGVFFCDCYDVDSVSLRLYGARLHYNPTGTSPSNPISSSGGSGRLSGTYKYKVTFVDDDGVETDQSDSTTIIVDGEQVNLVLPTYDDMDIIIYRTESDGDTYYVLAELDGSTTTYTDNISDSDLIWTKQDDNTSIWTKQDENDSIWTKQDDNTSIWTKIDENDSIWTKKNENDTVWS